MLDNEIELITSLPQTERSATPAPTRRIEDTAPGRPSSGALSPVQEEVPVIPQLQPDKVDDILAVTPPSGSTPSTPATPVLTSDTRSDATVTGVSPNLAQPVLTPGGSEPQSVARAGATPSSASPRIQRTTDPTISQDESAST